MPNGLRKLESVIILIILIRLRSRIGEEVGRKVGARQNHQAGQKCPKHQSHGEKKWPIHLLEIEPWKGFDVKKFTHLPKYTHGYSSRHNTCRFDFAVRQNPVNEEENRNAGRGCEYLKPDKRGGAKYDILVSTQNERQPQLVTRC